MIVVKTIKFDLPIDGVKVKNLNELREHFTVEILDYYSNGVLAKWLKSRSYIEELEAIENLQGKPFGRAAILKALCEVFKVEHDDAVISLTINKAINTEDSNLKTIIANYKNQLNKQREEENLSYYKELVNTIDYSIYYTLRLTILSNHHHYNSPEIYAKPNDFFIKSSERMAQSEIAQSEKAFGWFLCSEFAYDYDHKSYGELNNAYLFKSIQQQRKNCICALAQATQIPLLQKLLLERCTDLDTIIQALPEGRGSIANSETLKGFSDKYRKLVFFREGMIALISQKILKTTLI